VSDAHNDDLHSNSPMNWLYNHISKVYVRLTPLPELNQPRRGTYNEWANCSEMSSLLSIAAVGMSGGQNDHMVEV